MNKLKNRPNLGTRLQWKKLVYNSMYENDYAGLKKNDLYPIVEQLSRMAINRRTKFKEFYETHSIPLPIAYKDIGGSTKSGLKTSYLTADFDVSQDMTLNELRAKFRLLRGFLRTKTSTQKGWEKTIDKISDKLIYSTISKYKTVDGVNIKKTKRELNNELAQKRIDFKNRFSEKIGEQYYDVERNKNTTFYDIMWRVYNRVSEMGLVKENVQSATIKVIYDLMETKGQSSISELVGEVEKILKKTNQQDIEIENRELKKVLEDAGMDTELFFDIGDNE